MAEKTNGLIPTLLDPSITFSAVLANALYFKGFWATPFSTL